MKIETPRLTLRDFTPADGPALHAILGDGEVMAFAEPPYTPAQTQAFLEQFCIARRGGLACVEKATGQLVGYLLFSPLGEQVWELGWFFRRDTWGKGFATLSKPSPPGRSSPKPSTPAGLPVCWRNWGFAGKAPSRWNRPPGGGPCCINTPFVPRIGNGKNRNGAGKFQRRFSLPC